MAFGYCQYGDEGKLYVSVCELLNLYITYDIWYSVYTVKAMFNNS